MSIMTLCRRRWGRKLGFFSWLIIGGAIASSLHCAQAQITPDGTLPNNSRLRTEDNIRIIEGGTQAGSNLFHSFQQFSVPTGSAAYFNNAPDIQNIISRVTGGSVSNIDGLIRANGTANLFLINPSGIVFGPNASLNVGGSFLASTASSLKFADGTEFSAKTPQTSPLLTISVPIGLQYGQNPGSIRNQSLATDSSGKTIGLQVQPRKTLGLVGGNVVLEGGNLTAPDGRIELGSVAGSSFVNLIQTNTNYILGYQGVEYFQDLRLTQRAIVDTSGDSGGSIQVQGANVTLTDGSQIMANVLGAGSGEGLTVNASKSVQVIGVSANGQFSGIGVQAFPTATGKAGDLTITTPVLLVGDGAMVSASTFGSGNGGSLSVTASESVQLIGTSSNGQFTSGLFTQTEGAGKAGDLRITTPVLLVRNGARVSASTFGGGKGGNLTVTANKVQVIGDPADGQSFSALSVKTQSGATGDAGNLTINTGELLIQDGAEVSAGTLGGGKGGNLTVTADKVQLGRSADGQFFSALAAQADSSGATGDAGDLTINTGELLIQGRAFVSASTFGSGKGGSLTVTANKVQVIGDPADDRLSTALAASAARGATGDAGDLTINTGELLIQNGAQVSASTFGGGKGGNLTVTADKVQVIGRSANDRPSGLIAGTQGTGKAGNLNITTQQLLISNGAQATASSTGVGVAGDLGINASSVQLDNGKITSQTRSGNGGNLKLNVADLLLMRRGSEISTTAGTAQQPGDGGNITINAPSGFIVAVPKENSDITANAFSGSGGKIQINATGIFGLTVFSRQDLMRLLGADDLTQLDFQRLPSSITAISQTSPNLSGTVTINTLGIDPTQGLVNLPVIPVDTTVAQGCYAGGSQAQSEFIITGRGGLPPNPGESLTTDAVQVDLVTLNPKVDKRSTTAVSTNPTNPTPPPIVEATGWVIDADGNVTLTANPPTVTPHSSWQKTADCRAFNPQQGR